MTSAPAVAAHEAVTPTVRATARRARFWAGVALLAVVVAVVTLLLRGGTGVDEPFSPDSAAPAGAAALAEVLRDGGVDVRVAATFAEASAAVGSGEDTTLLVHDALGLADRDRWADIQALPARTVVFAPDAAALEAVAPGVLAAGVPLTPADGTVGAGCALPAAEGAGSITASTSSFRVTDGVDADACFVDEDGAAQVVRTASPTGERIVVAAVDAFDNDSIVEAGNAAFALDLLGEDPVLVWYRPGFADASTPVAPTLAELTPGWATPVAILLLLLALSAALSNGRRLGPLVAERLPSVVPALETTEGRARLYRSTGSRLRAADQLRMGALRRLAPQLGLGSASELGELVAAVAARLRRPEADVRATLVDDVPASDRALGELRGRLADLEDAVRASRTDLPPATDTAAARGPRKDDA